MDFRFQNNQVLCCSDIHIDSADTLYEHLLHLAAAPLLLPPNVSVQVRGTRAWGGRSDVQPESGLRSDFC